MGDYVNVRKFLIENYDIIMSLCFTINNVKSNMGHFYPDLLIE